MGRTRRGASQAQVLLPRAGKGPAGPATATKVAVRPAPAVAGRALARLPLEQKSLPLDGSRCRHIPFGMMRAVDGEGKAVPLACKRWRCEDCGPGLKKRLKRSFVAAIEENPDLRRFFTLTMPGKTRQLDLEGRYVALSRAFQQFRQKMARIQGRPFPYALVREPHRDGTPHIHGLTDRYVPFKQLAQVWASCGGGYVDIRFVDPQRSAAYLSKYLSKDGNPPPKGFRKYAAGGGVALTNVRPKGDGKHRLEVKGHKGEWMSGLDSRQAFMQLRWLERREGRRRRLAELEEAGRMSGLEAAALHLTRCVACGGDHDIHPT